MIAELMLFIVSVLPVFLIGLFIYRKDREKEPLKLLLKLFLGGILSCLLVLIITPLLAIIFPIITENSDKLNLVELIFHVFVGVALIEEGCKWLVAYVISYHDRAFDELYDAILYCIFVALGFACFENLLYVYQTGIAIGILRAVLAVPGHACDGMFMGYYLGLAKNSDLNNNKKDKRKYLILSIVVPIITHGIYDYCLFSQKVIFVVLFFIFVIGMYIYVFKTIKKVATINRKMKYKDNYCPICGHVVDSDYCPGCGRKNS